MIRTFSSGVQTFEFTTQLFFDPTLTLQVIANAPYNTRGNPDTSSETLLSLASASGGGYTTTVTLGVQT
jgi:hypothetical protein